MSLFSTKSKKQSDKCKTVVGRCVAHYNIIHVNMVIHYNKAVFIYRSIKPEICSCWEASRGEKKGKLYHLHNVCL